MTDQSIDPVGQSTLEAAIREYSRLSIEYADLAAHNYALTQKEIIPGSRPFALTFEQSETLGREQHKLHVALYESRCRLRDLTEAMAR